MDFSSPYRVKVVKEVAKQRRGGKGWTWIRDEGEAGSKP